MSTKTEYNSFNEDDFVESSGEMKELTITISLCEYRNLIREQAQNEMYIDDLEKKCKDLERQANSMKELLLYDHPEFHEDLMSAVSKLLLHIKNASYEAEMTESKGKTNG